MKYMLVTVIERDIHTPQIFNTHEEALDKMCEEVANELKVTPEEIKESYLCGKEYNRCTCVIEDAAWAEYHGDTYVTSCDWRIFTINDAGEVV